LWAAIRTLTICKLNLFEYIYILTINKFDYVKQNANKNVNKNAKQNVHLKKEYKEKKEKKKERR
jgi:hypothetical protein